jgi:membrane protease YdiL (CAAX protease family)
MINKFLQRRENTFLGKLGLVGAAFAFLVIYTPLFVFLVGPMFRSGTYGDGPMQPIELFIRACVIAPLWEEMAFRYVPLQLAKGFGEEKFSLPMIVCSSVFFGIIHGGPGNIFVQGIAGLCLSAVYIKSNYSLWTNMTLHGLWNTFVMFIIPLYA